MTTLFEMGLDMRGKFKQNIICFMIFIVIFIVILRLTGLLVSKVKIQTFENKTYIIKGRLKTESQKELHKHNNSVAKSREQSESYAKNSHATAKTNDNTEISEYVLVMIKDIIKSYNTVKGEVRISEAEHFDCPPVPRKINGVEDLLCMPSPVFLPEFKNPCWYSNEGKFQCLPYFQIFGMDKSGSTDMFDKIAKHPDVLKNDGILQKETMWWSWLRYGHWLKSKRKIQSFHRYLQYFSSAAETIQFHQESKLITADGTPMDLWDMSGWHDIPQNKGRKEPVITTPHLIHHMNPKVKLIIILRDPVERLFSDYFFLKQGDMTVEAFHLEVLKSIEMLHFCTRVSSLRSCLFSRQLHVKLNARIHLGFYSVFLKDWLQVFPRDKFFIATTETYANHASQTLRQVFDFLGLRELTQEEVDQFAGAQRLHVTKNKEKAGKMLPQTRLILERLYETFTKELGVILEDDQFLWKTKAQI